MYGKSRVNLKVERDSTFFFSRVFASIYFISASKIYVHTHVNDYATVEIHPNVSHKKVMVL